MSTTSSRYTADWDTEMNTPVNTSPGPNDNKTNVLTAFNLSDWTEHGPSAPAKRSRILGTTILRTRMTIFLLSLQLGRGRETSLLVHPRRNSLGTFDPCSPFPRTKARNLSTPGRDGACLITSTNHYRSHQVNC
ncbi:hypothetical protein M378DRAFT_583859 [Amanita muscaria Koide BX008]|uniref:Uncharacterized protein n=1 Tax=Amanita muscaria (strain Koide BX008) TaxID=946122 RepID=A0A0C2RZ13_AMAMK|nr:hypothetical protein M378DRAFT_583859 [Amanita muscaria Koide BX008]